MYAPIIAAGAGASGLPGAAGIAAFAGGPIGIVAAGVFTGIQVALQLIGRGRQEADLIVPIQNQIGELLHNINLQMLDPATSLNQLYELRALTVDAYQQFDAFTRDAKFTDGRASIQARDTIRPLVDGKNNNGVLVRQDGGTIGGIDRLIAGKGGGGAIAAAGAGDSNGLLYAGLAALAAKLLGVF